MTANALKKQIHQAVDAIDDAAFLQAVFTIVSEKTNQPFNMSKEQVAILKDREANYRSGKTKTYKLKTLAQAVGKQR